MGVKRMVNGRSKATEKFPSIKNDSMICGESPIEHTLIYVDPCNVDVLLIGDDGQPLKMTYVCVLDENRMVVECGIRGKPDEIRMQVPQPGTPKGDVSNEKEWGNAMAHIKSGGKKCR